MFRFLMDCLLFPVEKFTTKKEELPSLFHLHPACLEEEGHVGWGAAQSLLMNRAEQIAKSNPGKNGFFQVDEADGSPGAPACGSTAQSWAQVSHKIIKISVTAAESVYTG